MQNKYILTSILFFFVGFVSLAQTDAPPQPQARIPWPPQLPIDSGVIALLILALSYGAYKAFKFSKKTI